MIIAELPNTQEKTFVTLHSDGCFAAKLWGVVDEVHAMEHGRWHITIKNGDNIVGFMYADAIRRT